LLDRGDHARDGSTVFLQSLLDFATLPAKEFEVPSSLQLRPGDARIFWVANVLELFERFAYYGSKAVLAVYIAEQIGLGSQAATFLAGSVFNTLLYLLPPLAGTIVDRYGFKRS
jgi:dipeptide/tripeptide permease